MATQGIQRVVEMLAESHRKIKSDVEQAQRRIAEQTARANKDLAREVAEAVRAARSLARGGAARARWLLIGTVIGAVCCTVAFLVVEIVTASNVFHLVQAR